MISIYQSVDALQEYLISSFPSPAYGYNNGTTPLWIAGGCNNNSGVGIYSTTGVIACENSPPNIKW